MLECEVGDLTSSRT
ncbi:hypothetical protein [Nostoc sp.]